MCDIIMTVTQLLDHILHIDFQFISGGGLGSPSRNVCLISFKAVSTAPNCNPRKDKGWGGDVCVSPLPLLILFRVHLYAFKGLAGINLFTQVAIVLELALVPSQGSEARSSFCIDQLLSHVPQSIVTSVL
jgi:hypothetical protein